MLVQKTYTKHTSPFSKLQMLRNQASYQKSFSIATFVGHVEPKILNEKTMKHLHQPCLCSKHKH